MDTHRHKPGLRSTGLSGFHAPSQAEVAHFQVAIGIEQQIRRFEITMDDICAVQSLECPEGLVHEILLVGFFLVFDRLIKREREGRLRKLWERHTRKTRG